MIRAALAWTLLGVGHVISRPMVRWDWASWIYPAYNRIMLASNAVQGDGPGPWKAVG